MLNHPKEKRRWSYKLRYIFVSCLWEQELSYSYSFDLTGFLPPISVLLWDHLIIFLQLKFLLFLPFLFYFSASKSAQYFLVIFRNIFIILFMPQATKATPSFSLLPALYTHYLYCLLLICSLPWLIDYPPVTLLSLLLWQIRCF